MHHNRPKWEAREWEEVGGAFQCSEAVPALPAPDCGGQSCSLQKWRRGSWTSTR